MIESRVYKGILNKLYSGSYHKNKAIAPIISHKDTDFILITKIKIGEFYFDFMDNVPDEYNGKETVLEESFHDKEGKIKEHRQVLSSKGLKSLIASISFIG